MSVEVSVSFPAPTVDFSEWIFGLSEIVRRDRTLLYSLRLSRALALRQGRGGALRP